MNYRHGFHAGNFADVMKHALLARILVHLCAKPGGFRVVDTHAGTGRYNLASEAANRTGEWRDGIDRLTKATLPSPVMDLVAPWLDLARPMLAEKPPAYPGSPLVAVGLTRSQDRVIAVEKHPEDFRRLRAALAGHRNATALHLDGWDAWKAQVPPPERRGLVLVDPPFEEPGEFARLVEGLRLSARKWAGGIVALWYPVKSPAEVEAFHDALAATGIRKILRCELYVDRVDAAGPLAGSGLVVVNPPWQFEREAGVILAALAPLLARADWSGWRVDWITPE